MRWTLEEDEYLIKNQKNLDRVVKKLDRTRDSCNRRLYRINHSKAQTEKLDESLMPEQMWFTDRASRSFVAPTGTPKGAISKAKLSPWTGSKRGGNAYRHTRTGYRHDIELNVRSGWEANVIRVLNSYAIPFEYEPLVFNYPIKRGNKSYTPDLLIGGTEFVEIKGYFDKNSMIKMKRFKKYYPNEWDTLTMIISKSSKASRDFCAEQEVPYVIYYEEIGKIYKSRIANWEG